MKRVAFSLILLAAACETPAQVSPPLPEHAAPAAQAANVSDKRDCAVFAGLLRHAFPSASEIQPRLQRGDPAKPDDYRITCDFSAESLAIQDYDYSRPSTPGAFQGWVSFGKPTYPTTDTATATISVVVGPLAGSGKECSLRRFGEGWEVNYCRTVWMS